jgi:Protein of unknown function (DUF2827)
MKVGITFTQSSKEAGIWENGAGQNTYFLLEMLRQSPEIEQIYLINYSPFEGFSPGMGLKGLEKHLVRFDDIKDEVDVVIESSVQVDRASVDYLRNRGCAFVGYRMGNDYVIDIERILFDRTQGLYLDGIPYDEIWTTPQHVKTCKSYWDICYSAPLHVMPHIWSPYFLDQSIQEFKKVHSLDFGYQPGKNPGQLAVLEPNINVVKTAVVPTLVVEAAYRRAPQLISHLFVTNGMHIANKKGWAHFVNTLKLFKDGKISTEPRYLMAFFMSRYASTIVTHQWENELNYMYYDALYGNYPLVHNSPMIKDYGYYYPDFDADAGADALIRALTEHDQNLEAYSQKSKELLHFVSTHSADNLEKYMQRLRALVAERTSRPALTSI